MKPFRSFTAIAAPLLLDNINTDDIFPGPIASPVVRAGQAEAMTVRGKMGKNAFSAWRWNDDLSPKPEFNLNQPPYDQAGILLAGENFGCGSSREMAVWCIEELGIRCIIAPSFGDIFHNNCFKSGLLPVRLPREEVERLAVLSKLPSPQPLTVDLEGNCILAGETRLTTFTIDAYQRALSLDGLDEISSSIAKLDRIAAHRARYLRERPWLSQP